MKTTHILLLGLFLLIVSCGTIQTGDSAISSLQNEWILQDNNVAQSGLNSEPITLIFDAEAENRVNGFAGCNWYSGSYSVTENIIEFSQMASTKRACPDLALEDEFLKLLNDVDRFEIRGNNLYLYKDKLLYLHFKK